MRARGSGRIVFCSSVLGLVALPYRGAYTASKFAVEALSDTLRLELAGSGVHVSTIQPGPIESRFNEHALDAFHRNIDWRQSVHRAAYEARLAQMKGNRPSRFRRGPEAVFDKLLHALESKRPRPHYHVTTATGIAALCRRLLPRRIIDTLARRIY
jgi:short-subunit dehydrogenase